MTCNRRNPATEKRVQQPLAARGQNCPAWEHPIAPLAGAPVRPFGE